MSYITVVVPVYNEELVLQSFIGKVLEVLESLMLPFEIILVNDGSTDGSLSLMKRLRAEDARIKVISFSRNFGHQAALTAGIDAAVGDAVIMMDADLQHPPQLIPELIRNWELGSEVVYTIRKDTEKAGIFKKLTSHGFYKLMRLLTNVEITDGASDFRLMDRKVVERFRTIRERSRFLRGLVSWIGFKQVGIEFTAPKRLAGSSKYSVKRMMKFAVDGITAFSGVPLQLAMYFGFLIALFAFVYLAYAVIIRVFTNAAISGWASLIVTVLFLGGVQLITLGIMGEYVVRIYEEVKQRPIYIVDEALGFEGDSQEAAGVSSRSVTSESKL